MVAILLTSLLKEGAKDLAKDIATDLLYSMKSSIKEEIDAKNKGKDIVKIGKKTAKKIIFERKNLEKKIKELMALSAFYVISADEKIKEKELEPLKSVLGLKDKEIKNLFEIKSKDELRKNIKDLCSLFPLSYDRKKQFFLLGVELNILDKELHPKEKEVVFDLGEIFEIEPHFISKQLEVASKLVEAINHNVENPIHYFVDEEILKNSDFVGWKSNFPEKDYKKLKKLFDKTAVPLDIFAGFYEKGILRTDFKFILSYVGVCGDWVDKENKFIPFGDIALISYKTEEDKDILSFITEDKEMFSVEAEDLSSVKVLFEKLDYQILDQNDTTQH